MIETLHIQNYRLFKDLTIAKLGQVNLIAGQNNSGKTALLEALRIFESKAKPSVINNIIKTRGGLDKSSQLKTYASLFYNFDYKKRVPIIFDSNKTKLKVDIYDENGYLVRMNIYDNDNLTSLENILGGEDYPEDAVVFVGLFQDFLKYKEFMDSLSVNQEDEIVQILKAIEPKIIDFRLSLTDIKSPRIRLEGFEERQPSRFLGDGINRLFTLALALVNAKGKMLLIDEFEVGLHYSIQEKLWEIVFEYAKKWDIQVFATTHSEDTVKAFFDIGNTPQYKDMANYIKLKRQRNGDIEAINFDLEEMETALLGNIEIR